MSIDAVINRVIPEENDLILDLMSREAGGHRGQPSLRRIKATHTPQVGQEVWGNAGWVVIEPGCGVNVQKKYKRMMYTQLEEDF